MKVVSQRVYHEGCISEGCIAKVYCEKCIVKVVL